MKALFTITLLIVAFMFNSFGQQKDVKPAKPGVNYGKTIDKNNAISVQGLENYLEKSDKFSGKLTGKVTQVCKSSGCFLTLQNESTKEPIMVRFADYAYIVPQDLVGKNIVLEGAATAREREDKDTQQKKRTITVIANGILVIK